MSSRSAKVFFDGRLAGRIRERDRGMTFQYDESWLRDPQAPAISRTLPKRAEPFEWSGPAPFFMGLLPEGWLHKLAIDALKIAPDDWFGQLLRLCGDCIGAVHIEGDSDA